MLIGMIVFMPIVSGILAYALGRYKEKWRDWFAVIVCAIVLLATFFLPGNMPEWEIDGIMFGGLHFMTDGFRAVYAVIAAFMWALTTVFSLEYFRDERENLNRYYLFLLATLGATEGVMLSADLMTAFVFFEILSFTSFTWVIHEETSGAIRAGYTYLFIAVIGGLVLFMGLLLMYHQTGTLAFRELPEAIRKVDSHGELMAAGFCILFGFGCKAGMFPVHVWLPKAHPIAPSPASALLSGILTKVGIYGILMTAMSAFAGEKVFGEAVLLIGVVTMLLGAVLAVFSINLKRTLACSSMSQIGFILTGTGMYTLLSAAGAEEGRVLALSGTMLHMVNHSLIKLTLFMAAGVVVMNLHALTLDDIRGFGRNKLFLKIAFALGALGISGVPLFNGYISKTLLHEGIVDGLHEAVWSGALLKCIEWIFLFSGGLTFAYMTKLFICVFVEKNKDPERQKEFDADKTCMNKKSTSVIFGSSLLMIILGQPAVMKRLAAYMTGFEEIMEFHAFTLENLKGSLISLTIGALVYIFFIRKVLLKNGSYVNLWPEWLDLEELVYRPVLTKWLPAFFGSIAAVFGENKVLRPVMRAVVMAGSVLARLLCGFTDFILILLRKTIFRQRKVVSPERKSMNRVQKTLLATEETTNSLMSNFSFAMMMTCLGILIILGTLVILIIVTV